MYIPVHKLYKAILPLVLLVASQTTAQETTMLDDLFGPITRGFQLSIGRLLGEKSDSSFNRAILEIQDKAARELSCAAPFPCDLNHVKLRSDEVPDSVHKLRPGDIDIIGAFGDSLTAGTGTSAILIAEEFFVSQRGRAWSGGGEKTWRSYLTLPNILKEFNPNLFGFALRASQSIEWEAQFNIAENGAISSQTPHMVKELVIRIKEDSRVDLHNQWKMVTLMIGDNDFCSEVCKLRNSYDSLEKHREDLIQVLRYLRDNLPRTIVNIVPPPRLDIFFEMKNLPIECFIAQNLACPCIRAPFYIHTRKVASDVMKKWQQVDMEVSSMPEFDLDDFTVIPHSFTLNYTFPRTSDGEIDYKYLAPDCFHFSEKGQARFANDLWNSLLEPFGRKSTDGSDVFSKFRCPSEAQPYIFTRRNSG